MTQPIDGKALRRQILDTLQKYSIKQVEVARETGMHHSTLCLWLQGKIKGPQAKIEATLSTWLTNLDPTKPRAPNPKHLVPKQSLQKASETKDMTMEIEKNPVYSQYSQPEELIPIRLDVENEGIRFKDTFVWNLNEPFYTPESMAKLIADDNGLPSSFEYEISSEIKKSIDAYRRYQAPMNTEMIRVIELDVRIENVLLKDRFEWDINNPDNIPEEFALHLCNELGLNQEFVALVAYSIREQIQYHQRDLLDRGYGLRGYDDFMQLKKSTRSLLEEGTGMRDKNLGQIVVTEDNYLRSTAPISYPQEGEEASRWEPKVEIVDAKDIARLEKLEDRRSRFEKRRR